MDLGARKQLPLFSIGIVQRLTGLTPRQIRYYEEHGLIRPTRTEGNRRLFSFADVERLMEVRRLLDMGMNMAGVKAQFAKVQGATPPGPSPEPSDEELYQWLQKQLQAGRSRESNSMFQGDLSRFYRR